MTNDQVPMTNKIPMLKTQWSLGHRSLIGHWGLVIAQSTVLTGCLLLPTAICAAQPLEEVTVFQSGTSGYHTFRIPAIVRANDGTLLAFAEGRRNSRSDFGDIDVVLRRSFDGGRTWGPLQLIHSHGTAEAGNASPVVDRATGNIILPFTLRFLLGFQTESMAPITSGERSRSVSTAQTRSGGASTRRLTLMAFITLPPCGKSRAR
jgi:hypothetical protein